MNSGGFRKFQVSSAFVVEITGPAWQFSSADIVAREGYELSELTLARKQLREKTRVSRRDSMNDNAD
jgi:hypothetical protein